MNKAKKSFFNVRLYLEGIRQLKVVGVMGAIILAGAAFLIPMGYNINNSHYEVYENGQWVEVGGRAYTYGIIEMNPLIVLTFFILTPLMVLILFNFLNRRNACDFYHAIPDTRAGLYISYGGSILTWNIAILLLSLTVTAISDVMFQFVEIDYSGVFVIYLNSVAGCLFMFGVFAIAMSLTGTVFTNLSVAVMLLMVPRIITTVFVFMLTQSIDIFPFTFGNSILDDRLNVVTNMVTGMMVRGDYDGLFMWKSLVYTFVVGLIYSVIGLFLFWKRKSEVAASAAVNLKMQYVFRLIPAVLISLFPLGVLIDNVVNRYEIYDTEIFMIVVLYLIAILAYFMYELITTKKLRNCIRSIPGLLGLAAFNLLFFGLFFASYHIILNDVPDTSNVKYVTINFDSGRGYRYSNGVGGSFYSSMVKDIDITSAEVKELLVEELERNIDLIKTDKGVWSYDAYASTSFIEGTTRVLVEFHTGLGAKSRYIYISPDKMEELMDLLRQNQQVAERLFTPVPLDEIDSFVCYRDNTDIDLTKEELYEVYLCYMEELKKLDNDEAYYHILIETSESNYDVAGFRFNLKSGKRFNVSLDTGMPKVLNCFLKLMNSRNEMPVSDLLRECLDNDIWNSEQPEDENSYHEASLQIYVYPKEDSYKWFSLSANAYTGEGVFTEVYGSLDLSDEKERQKLYDIADKLKGTDVITEDKTGNVVFISYADNTDPKDTNGESMYKRYSGYCIIDDATMELLNELY